MTEEKKEQEKEQEKDWSWSILVVGLVGRVIQVLMIMGLTDIHEDENDDGTADNEKDTRLGMLKPDGNN